MQHRAPTRDAKLVEALLRRTLRLKKNEKGQLVQERIINTSMYHQADLSG